MSNENELLEPLATEAGQQAIVRAINNLSSLEYAVRAEHAATTTTQKADEALTSATNASNSATEARNWATKTDGYVAQETIEVPSEQEGEDPTTETINLYSARYYAALAQDIYNNMQFDSEPTENSTNFLSSGAIYTALNSKADQSTTYTKTETDNLINTRLAELVASAPATLDTLQELATALGNDPNFATTIATQLGNKADKSDTYTKTEVDTALSNVQGQLTFDNTPTANSQNPVTSDGIYNALQRNSGGGSSIIVDSTITQGGTNPVTGGAIYTALDTKQDTLTFDTSPTSGSTNPVTSGGVHTALESKGDVTTDTAQNITGVKTFVGQKTINFKQSAANNKLGFTLYGNTGTERGYLEFNPQYTVDSINGLLTLGNYATSAQALTQLGFRRFSSVAGQDGAYNLLVPMIADAKQPFSLTDSYTNFYLPLGVTDGTTMVTTDRRGVLNIGSLIQNAINSIENVNGVGF